MQVIIVSHTEFGGVRGRRVVYDRSLSGITEGVPNLAAVAEKHGAKVTFAVMPETAAYFPPVDGHEIGLHVHPGAELLHMNGEVIEEGDQLLWERVPQTVTSSVLRDHPYSEQYALIRAGIEELEDRLSVVPTSFVAGRWSINDDTVRALIANGITHECSAVAHDHQPHYDWSRLPRICMPYHPSAGDHQATGDLPLIEIPIAQMIRFGSVNPEMVPWLGLPWLRACFREYYDLGLPVFHICLHSPCMSDPYFVRCLDRLLAFITAHRGVEMATASEIEAHGGRTERGRLTPYIAALRPQTLKTCLAIAADRLSRS